MSGTKAFAVSAGISPSVTLGFAATGAAVLGGVAALAIGAGAAIYLTGKSLQAYQERKRKEKEAAIEREKAIQQRIAQIKSMSFSNTGKTQVTVKPPKTVKPVPQNQPTGTTSKVITPVEEAKIKDDLRKINQLRSQIPKIKSEYQALIDKQLLDSATVQQTIQNTEQALNANHLEAAEAYLQALDDARIQVIQNLKQQWQPQISYLQERLEALKVRLPQAINQQLQTNIDKYSSNWQSLNDDIINNLHQQISTFEAQTAEIQEAANNLVNSWIQAGYEAHILGIDNGDLVIEVETHEGVNTQMRIQFNGQQINLFGPPEESSSCAARTIEAMRLFQEQGYQLEWTHLDNEPVAEEWRYLYTPISQDTEVVEELNIDEIEEDYEDDKLEHEVYEDEELEDKIYEDNDYDEDVEDEEMEDEDDVYYNPQSSQGRQMEQES